MLGLSGFGRRKKLRHFFNENSTSNKMRSTETLMEDMKHPAVKKSNKDVLPFIRADITERDEAPKIFMKILCPFWYLRDQNSQKN